MGKKIIVQACPTDGRGVVQLCSNDPGGGVGGGELTGY